ncbi:AzlD domain-containing protein [Chitinimonas lacunae]|uniref:AzlD domain-containing protein n=1 Tax=Chitinimonas lacunae TaxID=1963018 RepID=A0ABV8MLI4_9NEIS
MSREEALIIAGMAAVTFLIRYSFFAVGERLVFPPLVKRALRYVPVAVLSAIVAPAVLLPDGVAGGWRLDWRNAYLIAAIATAVLAWRGDRLLLAIGGGLAVFFAWRGLVGWSG